LRTKVNLETGEGIVVVKTARNPHIRGFLRNLVNLPALESNPALVRAVMPRDATAGVYHDYLWHMLYSGEEKPEVLHHPLLRVGGILIGQNTNNRGGGDAQTGTKNGVEYRVESVGEVEPRDLRQEILGMLKEEMTGKKATFKRKE